MAHLVVRKAKVQDVGVIHGLLMDSARAEELLPRSLSQLYSHVREFYVVVDQDNGDVRGCCALSITWNDLAEVRSLVVDPDLRRQGLGRKLVEACLSEAVTLGLYRVFTLTYQVDFFSKLGFSEVAKDVLPQKVWADCVNCPKFPDCDEHAMLLDM